MEWELCRARASADVDSTEMANQILVLLKSQAPQKCPDRQSRQPERTDRRPSRPAPRWSARAWRLSRFVPIWVALGFGFAVHTPAAEATPARLAVGPFLAPPDNEGMHRIASIFPELLTVKLSKSGEFDLVERAQIEAALAEIKLNVAGAVITTNISRLGQILSAEWLVSGSIIKSDAGTNIWIKVIDMRRGVVAAVQPLACAQSDVAEAADKAVAFVTRATLHPEPQQFLGVERQVARMAGGG